MVSAGTSLTLPGTSMISTSQGKAEISLRSESKNPGTIGTFPGFRGLLATRVPQVRVPVLEACASAAE